MIEIIFGMSFYNLLRNWLYLQGDKKIADSIVSFAHILLCLFVILINYFANSSFLTEVVVGNTCGYFINDTLRYIKINRNKFSDYVMIYHHVVTTAFIYNYKYVQRSHWLQALVWAELSNVPTTIVYYFIQKNRLSDGRYNVELALSKSVQRYVYTFIRVFILSYYTIMEFLVIGGNRYFAMLMPLHIMGYVWSYIILTKVR